MNGMLAVMTLTGMVFWLVLAVFLVLYFTGAIDVDASITLDKKDKQK